MISATLVTGASPARREAVIAEMIVARNAMMPGEHPDSPLRAAAAHHVAVGPVAALLEGFPSGKQDSPLTALVASHPLRIARIAAGCLCCTGNLTLRVTLNRLLREQPPAAHLFIAMDDTDHLPALRAMLQAAPYADWLALTADFEAR